MGLPDEVIQPAIAEYVAAEIRAEIARQDLTQKDLAAKIHQSQPWLSRRLAGLVDLTFSDTELIATGLDTSLFDFVERVMIRLGWRGPDPHRPSPSVAARAASLPHLDSNQKPTGYRSERHLSLVPPQVSRLPARA